MKVSNLLTQSSRARSKGEVRFPGLVLDSAAGRYEGEGIGDKVSEDRRWLSDDGFEKM